MRRFNTAGPCKPDIHYMLPPLVRVPDLRPLVDTQSYFVLHAPRQVGKTTAAIELAAQLTAEGRYTAAVLPLRCDSRVADIDVIERQILDEWRQAALRQLPAELHPGPWPLTAPSARVTAALRSWVEASPRPLVVLIDGLDALPPRALASLLRQLRSGLPGRPHAFPWSVGLLCERPPRELVGDGRLVSSTSSFIAESVRSCVEATPTGRSKTVDAPQVERSGMRLCGPTSCRQSVAPPKSANHVM